VVFYCAGTAFGYAGRVLSDGLCAGEGLAVRGGGPWVFARFRDGCPPFGGRLGLGKGLL